MSNITFMIGNGFDLACGLKSRFSDTYDSYIASSSASPIIEQFKQTIKKDIPTWADFEMQLVQYASALKTGEELIECIRDYNAYLNDYLVKEQLSFWETYNDLRIDANLVLEEICRSISAFYSGLTRNDTNKIEEIITGTNDDRVNYRFISFNYTDILDRLVNLAFSTGYMAELLHRSFQYTGVIHVHGSLGGDVTLGVDNEEQLVKIPFDISRRVKRVIIKPSFLQAYDVNRINNVRSIIASSDIICIFGLSLGESDLTWRKELARWLKDNTGHHLVAFVHRYMEKKYHTTAVTERMDDEEDCKEMIMSRLYNDTLSENERENLQTRIHVPVGVTIFNVKKTMLEAKRYAQERKAAKGRLAQKPV